MNPALLKLIAQMKGLGAKGADLGRKGVSKGIDLGQKGMGLGVNAAGSGAGSLAGMAARNPKTAAAIGAGGAGAAGIGAGMAMDDDDENLEEILALLRRG